MLLCVRLVAAVKLDVPSLTVIVVGVPSCLTHTATKSPAVVDRFRLMVPAEILPSFEFDPRSVKAI
ncbi:MAG TPA: hypothetical protein DCS05_06420 [Nitrospiraceae bacterium]|nr:hypothetical protein [Nitrospiraceae bacterium]